MYQVLRYSLNVSIYVLYLFASYVIVFQAISEPTFSKQYTNRGDTRYREQLHLYVQSVVSWLSPIPRERRLR